MKKLSIIFIMLFVIILSNFAFAYNYEWVKNADGTYSLELTEVNQPPLHFSGDFYNENGAIYYFDDNGIMCTGWYCHPDTRKIYFFNNNPTDKSYGQMATGFKTIDGYLRYFNDDGTYAKAERQGEKIPVGNYQADYDGNLFLNEVLQLDQTTARSDFYTDVRFYNDINLNNSVLPNKIDTWKDADERSVHAGESAGPTMP